MVYDQLIFERGCNAHCEGLKFRKQDDHGIQYRRSDTRLVLPVTYYLTMIIRIRYPISENRLEDDKSYVIPFSLFIVRAG